MVLVLTSFLWCSIALGLVSMLLGSQSECCEHPVDDPINQLTTHRGEQVSHLTASYEFLQPSSSTQVVGSKALIPIVMIPIGIQKFKLQKKKMNSNFEAIF